MCEINLSDNSLKKIAEDTTDQTLIYLDLAKDNIISFKGRVTEKNSITYLDTYNPQIKEPKEFKMLISKLFDLETQSGEIIYNFTYSNEILYVIVCTKNNGQISSWGVELYDLDGKQIGNMELDTEITQLLNTDRVSKFEVINDNAFIRTFSGGGVLFDLSSNTNEIKLLNELDLDISSSTHNMKDSKHILLFSRESGDIWYLDTNTSILSILNLPYETIRYIYVDEDEKMLLSSDETIYAEINDSLTKGISYH